MCAQSDPCQHTLCIESDTDPNLSDLPLIKEWLECKNRYNNDIEYNGNKWYIYKAIGSVDDVRNLKITEHYRLIEALPIRHRKAMTLIDKIKRKIRRICS